MVNYKIVPYDRSHTDEILTFGINDKLLENDTSSEEGRIDYGIPGLSFTLLADDNIVLCGGRDGFKLTKTNRLFTSP